jgi:hypothetical protein
MDKEAEAEAESELKEMEIPFYKSKKDRMADIKPIIKKLSDLELNTSYPAIKRLYKEIGEYMKDGESRKINIPFTEVKRRIKGFLIHRPSYIHQSLYIVSL